MQFFTKLPFIYRMDFICVRNMLRCVCIYILLRALPCAAQPFAILTGNITDENGDPLAGAVIRDIGSGRISLSDPQGNFELKLLPAATSRLEISFVGYRRDTIDFFIQEGNTMRLDHRMTQSPAMVGEVLVESWARKAVGLKQINTGTLGSIPLPSGNIESMLLTMGASSRNEMSSQYSVRGGSFDENLVYVNGVEIYRPMLIKAGQQEGLSFVNSSLVSSVQFSAGGFDASYGDKMSSVLDVRYKKPSGFGGSFMASFLGASAHLEAVSPAGKLTLITGLRYKTNQYLLNTLPVRGEYKPTFFDFQTYVTWSPFPKLELSLLGNAATNNYRVIPQSRSTTFGSYSQTLNFRVHYEGQETDRYNTLLGAFSLSYQPSTRLMLNFTASGYRTDESVSFDILGRYRIDLLDNTVGSDASRDSILNLGYGGSLSHARNAVRANIVTFSHTGSFAWPDQTLRWGFNMQAEDFTDRISEWEFIDSAGYAMPAGREEIVMYSSTFADNTISTWRYTMFIQHGLHFSIDKASLYLTGGLRYHFWEMNRQHFFSPRIRLTYEPAAGRDLSFHLAAGQYWQAPFYTEMRDPEGRLYDDVRAQRSTHYVLGGEVGLKLWGRPFWLTTELYYKRLDNLVPYFIDDVDIQYLPQYRARGYAAGLEIKLNGEFVKDAESWISFSLLGTREDRYGDNYGWYRRPTDQLVNFGLYFQDYLPNNPSYRIHLNMYYGSRLPYSSPEYDKPEDMLSLRAYKRIDIGLSKSFFKRHSDGRSHEGHKIDDLWFSLEVFNLFGFRNQASYQWMRTVSNQDGLPNLFAVPNYLTGRLLNGKITARF